MEIKTIRYKSELPSIDDWKDGKSIKEYLNAPTDKIKKSGIRILKKIIKNLKEENPSSISMIGTTIEGTDYLSLFSALIHTDLLPLDFKDNLKSFTFSRIDTMFSDSPLKIAQVTKIEVDAENDYFVKLFTDTGDSVKVNKDYIKLYNGDLSIAVYSDFQKAKFRNFYLVGNGFLLLPNSGSLVIKNKSIPSYLESEDEE